MVSRSCCPFDGSMETRLAEFPGDFEYRVEPSNPATLLRHHSATWTVPWRRGKHLWHGRLKMISDQWVDGSTWRT